MSKFITYATQKVICVFAIMLFILPLRVPRQLGLGKFSILLLCNILLQPGFFFFFFFFFFFDSKAMYMGSDAKNG